MRHLLFVYGTLKQGFHNHHCLGPNATLVSDNAAILRFKMRSLGGFPAIYETGEVKDSIKGELYEVDDIGFKQCDRLEGYPSFYNRKLVDVSNIVDNTMNIDKAWVYYMDRDPGGPLVENGVWKR